MPPNSRPVGLFSESLRDPGSCQVGIVFRWPVAPATADSAESAREWYADGVEWNRARRANTATSRVSQNSDEIPAGLDRIGACLKISLRPSRDAPISRRTAWTRSVGVRRVDSPIACSHARVRRCRCE